MPGTPEYHRQIHANWAEQLRQTGLEPRAATPPTSEPLSPRDDIPTVNEAHRIYEDLLARNADREIGIFHNVRTGQYAVRVGTAMEVSGPLRGSWETALHYHPNRANVLARRMPAPADVQGAALDAIRSDGNITEFRALHLTGVKLGRGLSPSWHALPQIRG